MGATYVVAPWLRKQVIHMSTFDNKTKPELERGNYIVYTDEPNTVVNGSGGGAVQTLIADYDSGSDAYVLDTEITFNEIKAAFDAGYIIHLKLTRETELDSQVDVCRMISWDYYVDESEPYYLATFMFQGSPFLLRAESPDGQLVIY